MNAAKTKFDQLERELAEARAEFQRLRLEYADKAIELTARITRIEDEARGLIGTTKAVNIGPTMKSIPRQVRSGRKATSVFAKAVGNARAWADSHKIPYSTVKKWTVKGKNGAAIPRKVAEMLLRQYKVPISSWPNGTYE